MINKNCLNCEKKLTDKFCSGCGQKADTNRITFKNFIFHDLLHGTFHVEKGMLFTAKQALIRPGQAALDYISGKRKRYYNVFYLILITIGVMLITRPGHELWVSQGEQIVQHKAYLNDASKKIDEIFSQKSKMLLLLYIPCAALNSFILFRRKKLNLSEHLIISGMLLLGILLIATFANMLFYINSFTPLTNTILSLIITGIILLYVGYGYYNAFGTDYTKSGIALRILLFFVLVSFQTLLLVYILIGYVTDWKFDKAVTLAPFG